MPHIRKRAAARSMKHEKWEKVIAKNCKDAGTYRKYFAEPVKALAMILEKRDQALEEWNDSGGTIMIEYTNKAGNTNMVVHPMLIVWRDLNTQALAYWKDLGLTPAGLKKINDSALNNKANVSALETALTKLSGA